VVKARSDRGILVASGLMAGGAILGVFDSIANAVIKKVTGSLEAKEMVHILSEDAMTGLTGSLIGAVGLTILCLYVVLYSRRIRD
jgi:hypothetical protein